MHRLGRFVLPILAILAIFGVQQPTQAQQTGPAQPLECTKPSDLGDFNKAKGSIRMTYRIQSAPNTWTCLNIALDHDGKKGTAVFTYKDGGKDVEKRGTVTRGEQGRVTLTVPGQTGMPVNVAVRPNGVIVAYMCNKPGGVQTIFVGYHNGRSLFKEADEEAKKLVQFPNQYRVDHTGCVLPTLPPTTETPPTTVTRTTSRPTPTPPTCPPCPTSPPCPPRPTCPTPVTCPQPTTCPPPVTCPAPEPCTTESPSSTTKKSGWSFGPIDIGLSRSVAVNGTVGEESLATTELPAGAVESDLTPEATKSPATTAQTTTLEDDDED